MTMTLAADPKQTYKVVLDHDKDAFPPPAFVCRYLTLRQWRQTARLYDEFVAVRDKDPDNFADKLVELLGQIVVGSENVGAKELPIEETLTVYEAVELLQKAWAGQKPDFEDKKKLSLPSDTSGESPAPPAKD